MTPFKFILTKDLENDRVHNYMQYPNSAPFYQGWFVNNDAAQQHVSCYLGNSNYIMQENKQEELVLCLGQSYMCETWTFTYPGVECNLEEFSMRREMIDMSLRGGITKPITGENPHKISEFYTTYWGNNK